MDATTGVALQLSQTRLEIGIAVLKQNADAQKQIADILQSSIASVPNSPVRGVNVNVKA